MVLELYEHNRTAYDAVLKLLDDTGKAAVIHPTGTGKSIIAFKLIEEHPELRICWFSPSSYIVKTQRENVCRLDPNFSDDHVIYCTYARLMNLDYAELQAMRPDYIILDEFHRCGAAEWGRGVQLLLELYPRVPVLGLSATNIRYLDGQRDMAAELFDGNIASEMSLAEAIATGILPAPIYITALFSYQKELERYKRRVHSVRHRCHYDENKAYLEALRRAMEMSVGLDRIFSKHMKDRSGKYIIFCSGKEHMDSVLEQIPEWFSGVDRRPHVYRVYADDPGSEQAFLDFKGDASSHLKLLLCIDMLSEGIHVEDISGVILLRPTASPIVYKQQIGRALAAGKGNAPVIFDIVNNYDSLSSVSQLQEEMRAVTAFYQSRGEGERIVEESFRVIDEVRECRILIKQLEESLSTTWEVNYQQARLYFQQHGDLNVPVSYRTDNGIQLGVWLGNQRRLYNSRYHGSLTPERIELLNRLGMTWENRYETHWDYLFQIAEDYYIERGHLRVPTGYTTEDGIQLGRWLRRQADHREQLTEEKIQRLNEIGMVWSGSWELRYETALRYLEDNPGCELTQATVVGDFWLGKWLVQQLRSYEKGTLRPEQAARMGELIQKTGLSAQTQSQRKWNGQYDKIKSQTERYGSWKQWPSLPELGSSLRWIRAQMKKIEKGTMPQSQLERLRVLDIVPESPADGWMDYYRLAERYYQEHGDLRIPAAYKTQDGVRLGAWICRQRSLKRGAEAGNGLSGEKIRLLDSIGMEWNPYRAAFERGVASAQRYYRRNGNLNVPAKYVDENGFPLSQWISDTRKKKDRLPDEDIQILEELDFVWGTRRKK